MLDHAWIAARIPHQGAMCLLDAVSDWSAQHIVCRALSHRDPANPLRAEGRLGAAAGIEYAAQAMAVHAALSAPDAQTLAVAPRPGYLASVRDATLHVARIDDVPGELVITAQRLSGNEALVVYRFAVSHRDRLLVEGRASVVLDAAAPTAFPS